MTRTHIGRWRLGEILGEGGMGTVFLAHHQTLELAAAAKILSPKLSRDPKFRERFLREARAQAQCRHPGIAQVMDFIEEGEDLCLVAEYLAGGTLEKRLVEGQPLPLATALTWARQALEALDCAHRRGIIHRDVKPSNIMLDEQERAKVVDFGIALVLDGRRLTTATGSLGTPHYMSPEQIRRPQEVDHRTDVYSMGVVLYEMLAGRPPFDADSEFDVQAAQVNEPPKPLRELNPGVPEEIAAVVLKALEKEPNARHAGCGEFARALEAVQEEQAAVVEPPPQKKETSSRKLGWLAACLGCLAVIVLVVLLVKINDLKEEREDRRAVETELANAESRAQALHELAVAKSWPWSAGETFDYPYTSFPLGFSASDLLQNTQMISEGKYRWQAQAQRSGMVSLAMKKGSRTEEGEASYLGVEIRKLEGNENAYGALVFRRGGKSYYSFRLAENRYSLWLRKEGSWTPLIDWADSSAIQSGKATRLAVIADGSRFLLFINDQNVDEISDSELSSGRVGIALGFVEKGSTATFDFDNFELRKRPSGG